MFAAELVTPGEDIRAPLGALRILSRADGSEILILHGEDRAVGEGERLVSVTWFRDTPSAAAASRWCSEMLVAARAPPGVDGWHPFHERHVRNLVNAAINSDRAGVIKLLPQAEESPRPWTRERVARLAFLAGSGWTAKRIAQDELIRSTPNNVYQQAYRLGISLSVSPQSQLSVRLPAATLAVIDRAASAAQLTRDAFMRRFIISATGELQKALQPRR